MCDFKKALSRAFGLADPLDAGAEQQKALDIARAATDGAAGSESSRQAAEARLRRLLSQHGYGAAVTLSDPLAAAPVGVKTLLGA